eukprot:2474674-Pyramimonas_sp.AAC.2
MSLQVLGFRAFRSMALFANSHRAVDKGRLDTALSEPRAPGKGAPFWPSGRNLRGRGIWGLGRGRGMGGGATRGAGVPQHSVRGVGGGAGEPLPGFGGKHRHQHRVRATAGEYSPRWPITARPRTDSNRAALNPDLPIGARHV